MTRNMSTPRTSEKRFLRQNLLFSKSYPVPVHRGDSLPLNCYVLRFLVNFSKKSKAKTVLNQETSILLRFLEKTKC